jgi:hypothetical protein
MPESNLRELRAGKAAGYYTQLLRNCETQAPSPRLEIAHARAFLAQMKTPPN